MGKVETSSGIKFIYDVLYVPQIDQNLLSVPQMLEKKYALHFENMSCIIIDPSGNEIMRVKMKDKSFQVNWKQAQNHVYTSSVEDPILWNKRLGHYNYAALKQMSSTQMVQDLPPIYDNNIVCEACQYGKQHKLPFPSRSLSRACKRLQLIHTDICGPMSTNSLHASKYFLIFIDDFTRMCWVYFLRHKSKVFVKFQKFKSLVENQSEERIKVLRSDNWSEYASREFSQFLQTVGIEHQLTMPYTPQQNGVSERRNRTIMEMAKVPYV